MGKPTCGVLCMESINEFCKTEAERKAFAVGHVHGQAEKVYLGACAAAMFRPQPDQFEWLLNAVQRVAARYSLDVETLPYEGDWSGRREIWISRRGNRIVGSWLDSEPDSKRWHTMRALACGIPAECIDTEFHTRRGYNEPCDGIKS